MTRDFRIAVAAFVAIGGAYLQVFGQAGGGKEFEAASIKANPPETGFHFASDSLSGGPGTSDPGMFRCSKCTLATLIAKAFDLRAYQFPGQASLGDDTFEVTAKIPAGTTPEEFSFMLRNLLKDRFGLAYHFADKSLRGYRLVVAKGSPRLTESVEKSAAESRPGSGEQHAWQPGAAAHGHDGKVTMFGAARYRADHQTMGGLAQILADQLGLPVEDQTGLTGQYDISLTWAASGSQVAGHSGGDAGGGHMDHGSGAPPPSADSGSPSGDSGPTLFDAVQTQLGLKLVPAEQTTARIFLIDHVQKQPTAN